jgi:integrase/recombinase XerD
MITVQAAVDDFLLAKEAGQRSPYTIKWYAALLKHFVTEHGARAVDSFTMREIAKWLVAETGSAHTKYDRSKVLHYFFSWCASTYGITNPAAAIPIPRLPEPEPKAIEPDDLNRLIEVCRNPRDLAILIVLADCGLRATSLIMLTVEDFDFVGRTIAVRNDKRGRTRAVPFSCETERVILRWFKRRPLKADRAICTLDGEPLTYWGLREVMRRLAVRAGFTNERCNLHSLRHFAAREYLKQGGSLPALARILGHKYIDTTSRYYAVYSGSELAEVHDAHSPLNSLKRKESI